MRLDECQCNHPYTITRILIGDIVAQDRFSSLGLVVGAKITPLYVSAKRATISIQVGQTLIALRSEEARQIEVAESSALESADSRN